MGNRVGHVIPGTGFLLIGLWHLFNHIRHYCVNPKSYIAIPWFPAPFLRYLEPTLVIIGSLISISMELFIGPEAHQPFDKDGTIPSWHLQNFEHASISFSLLIYASFAIFLDRMKSNLRDPLTFLLAAFALAQQLLVFHLHSADHMGVEGQYHRLLQTVIAVSLSTTLINIAVPKNFVASFVRSVTITFQGIWFIIMGMMLYTPSFLPKGCYLNDEGHDVVRCHTEEALHRAKSLVNLEFSWCFSGTVIFSMVMYVLLTSLYREEKGYLPLMKEKEEEEEEDMEAQISIRRSNSGNEMKTMEIER